MPEAALTDFVASERIADLGRPIKEAKGLPRVVYVDDAFYRFEQRALFPRQWVGAAYGAAIPEAGDAIPVTVAGLPLLLVRGEDGGVRAFHNVCRHRGTLVLARPVKRARRLRCAYHSWTWDLAGKLLSRPLWDGRDDGAADCLAPVRCRLWCGVVFVALAEETAPFDDYFGFCRARWAAYDFEALAPFVIRSWDVAANWKLHSLGVLEPYHEPFIHPQIINTVTDPKTGEKKMDNDTFRDHLEGNCIGLGTPGEDRDYNWRGDFPLLPGPPETGPRDQDIFLLFPNTTVAIFPDHVLTMICTPLDAGHSRVEVALHVVDAAATDPALEADRDSLLADWALVTEQDIAALELQQAGHASPIADDAKFSPFWESTAHYFEKRIVEELA